MSRHHRIGAVQGHEETPFVDLAFSILGPVSFLMLIFLCIAARSQRELRAVQRNLTDNISISSKQLQFPVCQTTFVLPDTQPIRDTDEFFRQTARTIRIQVTQHPTNRIDIFGHTDHNEVKTICRTLIPGRDPNTTFLFPVQDNEILSALRAYAFRNALMKAINADPVEFGTLAQQINSGQIRIYTIGVGAKEPVERGQLTETEWNDRCRRIEIRFGHDNIQEARR